VYHYNGLVVPCYTHIDLVSEPSIYTSAARPLIANISYLNHPFILHYYAADRVLTDAYVTSHWRLISKNGTLIPNPCWFPPSTPPTPSHPPPPSPPEVHDVLHIVLLEGFCASTPVLGTNVSGTTVPIMYRPDDDTTTPMFGSHAIHPLKAIATAQSSEVTATVAIHSPDHVTVSGHFVYTRVFGAIADEWQFFEADGTPATCSNEPLRPPLSPPPPAIPPVPSPPPFPPDYAPRSPPPAAPKSYCNYTDAMSNGMFSSARCKELKELWFPTHIFVDNSGANVFGYCLVDSAAEQVIVRQEAINYDEIDHLSYICS